MHFTETEIPGVVIVDVESHADERGSFSRVYCPIEFADADIPFLSLQISIARNRLRHTLRGMHHKARGMEEAKLVRCVRGAIFDVAVDLRRGSATFGRWVGVELDHASMRALLVPEGCSHGYLTLEDDTDVLYQISRPYSADGNLGFRWDDPAISIAWPAKPSVISDRDAGYADLAI